VSGAEALNPAKAPKPPSKGPKKTRAVRLDESSEGSPLKEKMAVTTLPTKKNSADDKTKLPTSKEVRSKSRPVKSPVVATKVRSNSDPKPAVKKQKALPEPVEAESEESEGEWVGFGGVDEESVEEVEERDEGDAEEEGDGDSSEEELLHGLSSDDQDSSDEEANLPGIDISKLPTIAKDDKVVKQKLEKAKRQPTEDRGVIYLGRVPHGFYEQQMKTYFTQFGDVTRLRLSRNKRTGRSRHYAFVEFDSARVAEIVAETMDNYLLMGHILKCRVVPKSEVHPELWIGADKKFKKVPMARVYRVSHNKLRTEEEKDRVDGRLLKRQEQRKRKLKELGIDYDFDMVAYKKKPRTSSF